MRISRIGLGFASLLAVLAPQPADAHSWAEVLRIIGLNGTFTGTPGYIRGYASRALAGFSDSMDTFLIPPNGRASGNAILATDSLCHPSQTIGNYSTDFPMLSASAGDYLALLYQENGHVSLPDVNPTKPLNRGTVYIYGTDQPATDEKFGDVFHQWTADGTGGNGRGRLLATRNFDDGQCYQVNNDAISTQRQTRFSKTAENPMGADLWCQNDLQLPTDLAAGSTYTLYWVWSWPTFDKPGAPTDITPPGYTVTTNQYYTSCMDVAVTQGGTSDTTSHQKNSNGNGKGSSIASSFIHGQDLNSAAVLGQLQMLSAFQVTVPGSGNSSSSGSGSDSDSTTTAAAPAATTAPTVATHGNGAETIMITVTEKESVYITVMVPASSSTPTPTTTSSSTHKTRTRTTTTFERTTVTETVSPSTAAATSTSSSLPTMVPTVLPFLNGTSIVAAPSSTTLRRVRRAPRQWM